MQPEHLDLHASYGHLYVTLNLPAVEPPGECLPNSEIFRRLARRWGSTTRACSESDEEMAATCSTAQPRAKPASRSSALRDDGYVRLGLARERRASPRAASRPRAARLRLSPDARGARRRSAHRLRATARARATRSSPTRYPLALIVARRPLLAQLHLRARCPGTAAAWGRRSCTCIRATRRRGIASGDARARLQRPRRVHRRGRGRRRRAPGRGLHLQAALAGAARPGRQHVNATTPERDADLGGGPTFHDNRVEISLASEGASSAPA